MSKRQTSAPIHTDGKQNEKTKRWLPAALAVAVLAAVALLFWFTRQQQTTTTNFEPQVTGQPKAVVSQTDFDYGDVKLNTTIETVFQVKNTGDQPLVFLREPDVEVREGC